MYCRQCGERQFSHSGACLHCGAEFQPPQKVVPLDTSRELTTVASPRPPAAPTLAPAPKRRRVDPVLALAVFACLLLACVCALFFYSEVVRPYLERSEEARAEDADANANTNTNAPDTPRPTPAPSRRRAAPSPPVVYAAPTVEPAPVPVARPAVLTLLDTSIVIGAGQYHYTKFEVRADGARLVGEFSAQGGRNDVEAFVLDAMQFENFRGGLRAQTLYNSGRATVGSFNVPLAGGVYYLIFNNAYSILTPKVVTVRARVEP